MKNHEDQVVPVQAPKLSLRIERVKVLSTRSGLRTGDPNGSHGGNCSGTVIHCLEGSGRCDG